MGKASLINVQLPIPVAARVLGLRVIIPTGHGCLSLMCVVRCEVKFLRRADHSSRVALPTVLCLSVIEKLR